MKQYAPAKTIEHSNRKGTRVLTPEARRKDRAVSVTAAHTMRKDEAGDRTPEGRRKNALRANGHLASEGMGLQAASEDNPLGPATNANAAEAKITMI